MPDSPRSSSRGYLIALSATVLWSFTGVLISYLSTNYRLPSLTLAFWRDLFVAFGMAVGLLLFSPARFRPGNVSFRFLLAYGLLLACFNSMWTFSVEYNGAAVATVLAFSSPAFTAILERWILKESLGRYKIIAIGLSILGTVLVSGAYSPSSWQFNLLGIVFGLSTGIFFAGYNLMGKTSANRSLDSWMVLFYSFSIATVFLFLFNLGFNLLTAPGPFSNFFWLGNSAWGWFILFFLGVGPTIGGFGLYTLSMHYLPATTANLIATLEPILTAVWAFFLLHELLTIPQLLGGVLIFSGVILMRWGETRGG